MWPDLETFSALAKTHRVIPVMRTVMADHHTALSVYDVLAAHRPGTFLLESAEHGQSWSRWSFIGVRSRTMLTSDGDTPCWVGEAPANIALEGSPLDALQSAVKALQSPAIAGTPPLSGGLIGYLGYDAVRYLEPVAVDGPDELNIPVLGFLLATDVAAVDHHRGTVTLIANAVNFNDSVTGVDDAWHDAVRRLDAMTSDLMKPVTSMTMASSNQATATPNPDDADYLAAVETAKEHIRSGDAFQIVLSQRFKHPTTARAYDIYRALRMLNPSPYMYLMRIPKQSGDAETNSVTGFTENAFDIIGSSPEALVRVQGGRAMLHPIAGTRPRGATDAEDAHLAQDLLGDTKEQAEHLMLVDLGRNDLGRVCAPGSVEVIDFMSVERYSHVMHLVSTVVGDVRVDLSGCDVLFATFPAGTLSGAPKPRAMQIIDELEPTRRGLYGGCVGYLDFAGNVDMAIAIRTALLKDSIAYVQAGAGIVADSVPTSESAECRHKAAAVLRAIAAAEGLQPLA
ncbi:MAG: anthranilate synthase component I [Chloroflexi bacterium]|nr:anthranilate synthase component I [Chloroflexota bacterium]